MAEEQLSRWYQSGQAYYAPFLHAYDNAAMWNDEPRMQPYRDLSICHLPGWPAPASRAMAESVSK